MVNVDDPTLPSQTAINAANQLITPTEGFGFSNNRPPPTSAAQLQQQFNSFR
jgi:uncharacterized protein (DUF2141 family)